MASLHLKVAGMHCDNCRMKVEKALKAIPGTYAVQVDVQHGDAEVDFDGKTPAERFISAVQSVGYKAEVAA